jgi:pentatricopeptide repeat protein
MTEMPLAESGLQMNRRHIVEQIARIRSHVALIDRMARKGQPTDAAESLLDEMVSTLRDMRTTRRRLLELRRIQPRSENPMVPLLPLGDLKDSRGHHSL